MLRYFRAHSSFCTFGGRRSQVSLSVAFLGPRPQSTCTVSTPRPDTVVPLFVYQQSVSEKKELHEKREQLHEKTARRYETLLKEQKAVLEEQKEMSKKCEKEREGMSEEYEEEQERMCKKYERKQERMCKKYEEEQERRSKKYETYAFRVAALRVGPSSACAFSTSLTILRPIY